MIDINEMEKARVVECSLRWQSQEFLPKKNVKLELKITVMLQAGFCSPDWSNYDQGVLYSSTGTQGNSHCIFFVQDSLIMCGVLFGLLYRFLCTGTGGQSPPKNFVASYRILFTF